MSCDNLHQGKMIIVTAPSGAGKTTIVRHLLKTFDFLDFSVSVTTRPKRDHEVEGKHYFFRTKEEFKALVKEDALAEWEEVYEDRFYGTLKDEVERIWKADKHIIFDIDVKGALNLQNQYRERCLSVMIQAPSLEELANRLKKRKTETEESLRRRLDKAVQEMSFQKHFDKVLINDDLQIALKNAENIVRSFIFEEEE